VLRRGRRQPNERGATLVEFAFVLPLFILLLFAIIDFGWLFTQFLDVKQGAREGARLAVVNDCDQTTPDNCRDDLIEKVCDRTNDLADSSTAVTLSRDSTRRVAIVSVSFPARSLTGILSVFINGNLTSNVEMRWEQDPLWSTGTAPC
jgi:Flp pilus assembly protein TadG